ncbi:MAG: hypothetical protein ABFD64_11925 [Armatimonadota bacterium]
MGIRFKVAFYLCLTILLSLSLTGCGGGSSSSSTGIGVEAVGTLTSDRSRALDPAICTQFNPNYPDCYQIPRSYQVAVSKLELLKGENDTTPYVVFDKGGVDNAELIDLTAGSASLGANNEYPATGTYTHVRMTLAYSQFEIKIDLGGNSTYDYRKFRLYTSTVGNVHDGDLIMQDNNDWCWMVGSEAGLSLPSTTGDRPEQVVAQTFETSLGKITEDNIIHDFFFSKDTSDSPDPYIQVIQLTSPIVVPANPTGKFSINVNFDITKSPLISGSTGTFFWDDVQNDDHPSGDGIFRPGRSWGQTDAGSETGTSGDQTPQLAPAYDSFGTPFWCPLPPTVSVSLQSD